MEVLISHRYLEVPVAYDAPMTKIVFSDGEKAVVSAEARVAEGGVAGIFLNIGEQGPPGFKAADTTAEFIVLGEGDGTGFAERVVLGALDLVAHVDDT